MREWNLEDFPKLNAKVKELNRGYYLGLPEDIGTEFEIASEWCKPWKLSLKLEKVDGGYSLELHDECEELYYEGFRFEKTMEELERAIREDTEDKNAYFDCVCPGLWTADWKGRDEFTKEDMALEMKTGISRAILDYMKDHDNKAPIWTDEKRKQNDMIEAMIDKFCEDLF